jgi:hypothetical protein
MDSGGITVRTLSTSRRGSLEDGSGCSGDSIPKRVSIKEDSVDVKSRRASGGSSRRGSVEEDSVDVKARRASDGDSGGSSRRGSVSDGMVDTGDIINHLRRGGGDSFDVKSRRSSVGSPSSSRRGSVGDGVDSFGVTPRVDSFGVTPRVDSFGVTPRVDSFGVTPRTLSSSLRGITEDGGATKVRWCRFNPSNTR